MPGYSFGGSREDYERFRNAGGGSTGAYAGGRRARRVIGSDPDVASPGDSKFERLVAKTIKFRERQAALDRRKDLSLDRNLTDRELGKQALVNRGAIDAANISRGGALERTQLEQAGQTQRTNLEQSGLDRRTGATLASNESLKRYEIDNDPAKAPNFIEAETQLGGRPILFDQTTGTSRYLDPDLDSASGQAINRYLGGGGSSGPTDREVVDRAPALQRLPGQPRIGEVTREPGAYVTQAGIARRNNELYAERMRRKYLEDQIKANSR